MPVSFDVMTCLILFRDKWYLVYHFSVAASVETIGNSLNQIKLVCKFNFKIWLECISDQPIKIWQTVSRRYQTTCKQRCLLSPQCPPPGIKHRFSWCMTRQPCVCTKVTLNTLKYISTYLWRAYVRMSRTRDDVFVTHAGRAVAHLWRMPGFGRTSISTLHWWWPRVDFSKLKQFVFVPHTNNLVPSIWLSSRNQIVQHFESLPAGVQCTSLSFSYFCNFVSSGCSSGKILCNLFEIERK